MPKAALEFSADPHRIFREKHQRDALAGLARYGIGDDIGRVAGHRAGIPETKINVVAIIDVGEMRALADFTKMGKGPAHFFIQLMGTPPRSESCAAR